MKTYLKKIATGAAGVGIFLLGGMVAWFGLSVMFVLAIFALAVAGLGLLAAPLVAMLNSGNRTEDEAAVA